MHTNGNKLDTTVRAFTLYLRALCRGKHEKTATYTPVLSNKKIIEASRFTPFYHY